MKGGWIKIARSIRDHWLWNDPEKFLWFLDLVCEASWDAQKVLYDNRVITLERGQLIASLSQLAQRWQMSRKSLDRKTVGSFLNLLIDEGMIEREVRYRSCSIITICNYEEYQSYDFWDSSIDSPYKELWNLETPPENPELFSQPMSGSVQNAFLREFLKDGEKLDALNKFCFDNSIPIEEFMKMCDVIFNEWTITETVHKDFADIASHLLNSVKSLISKKHSKKKVSSSRPKPEMAEGKNENFVAGISKRLDDWRRNHS